VIIKYGVESIGSIKKFKIEIPMSKLVGEMVLSFKNFKS